MTLGGAMNPADESQPPTTPDRRQPGVQRHQPPEVAGRLRAADEITQLPGTTTDFSPNGGVVMYNPAVFAIYWGREYGTSATGINALAQQFNAFFSTVLDSNYMDPLSQYDVNHGTFLGSTWVDHDPETPQTLDENGFQTVLANWLDAGMPPVKPAADEHDLLFVIFVPAEVTMQLAGHLQTEPPPNGFCAYHYWGFYQKSSLFGQSNLFWAAITSGADTSVVAHELVEAFTDRDYNGWRSGVTEIGDACN